MQYPLLYNLRHIHHHNPSISYNKQNVRQTTLIKLIYYFKVSLPYPHIWHSFVSVNVLCHIGPSHIFVSGFVFHYIHLSMQTIQPSNPTIQSSCRFQFVHMVSLKQSKLIYFWQIFDRDVAFIRWTFSQ